MFETRAISLISAIVNHPTIRPTIEQGDHRVDVTDFVMNTDNVVYACEHGVALFKGVEPGVFEGHVAFLPAGRGAIALREGKDALDRLFADHGAQRVSAAVPLQLPGARYLCRRLGFVSLGADSGGKVEHFVMEA